MVHNAITKHIVTKGDYNMVPKDQRLFDCPTCKPGKGGKKFYNVAPGQLVAYTISKTTLQPITVDATNIDTITGDLYIGVGVDTDGDGAADDVRLLAGEKFEKCMVDEVSVSHPVCGQPQILAAYLDCVKCWETYAVQFSYSDNRTRSFGLTRADQDTITTAISPECCGCTDCPQDANCEEVICKLVDALNEEFDYSGPNGEPYPDKKGVYLPKPYRAVRLHDNWNVYCLAPNAATCDCEGCITTEALVSATIGGEVVTFSGNLNPADDTQTYLAQLKNIAQQIECGFNEHIGSHSGFAFVAGGGPDHCCPYQLHVVTCDDNFVLTADSGTVTACTSIEPYPAFTPKSYCVDCGAGAPADYTPTCGLAVIIEQPDFDCDCYIEKPLAWYGRTGELTFIKDADSCTPIIKAKELLAPKFPRNFGAWIRWQEYSQETGGKGRTYRDVNARQGWLGVPDSVSRARNAITHSSCSKSYVTYYIGHSMRRRPVIDRNRASGSIINRLSSYIHIPEGDLNTIGSWETFYAAWAAAFGAPCFDNTITFPTPTPTATPTATPTPTPTPTPTATPTATPTPTPSPTP